MARTHVTCCIVLCAALLWGALACTAQQKNQAAPQLPIDLASMAEDEIKTDLPPIQLLVSITK